MLTLCGFAASNYHNKVKLALLEKGVPFEEEIAWACVPQLCLWANQVLGLAPVNPDGRLGRVWPL